MSESVQADRPSRLTGPSILAGAALALSLILGAGPAARADISGVVHNPATGHYYKWVQATVAWPAAKTGAEALGGYLAAINNDAERIWIDQYIRPANTACFVGATDGATEGTWLWLSGEPWSYTFWNSGEPNNSGDKDYLMLNSNGTWNDVYGTYNLPGYIVEWDENPNIPPPPGDPANLTAQFSQTGSILLAWQDNSTNEDRFEVWRKTTSGNYTRIANTQPNVTAYEDALLGPSTTYTYKVRAANLGGNSNYTNEASLRTPDSPLPPAPPTDILVMDAGAHTTSFQWTDNSDDEIQFQVYRGTAPEDLALIGVAPSNGTSYDDAGLRPDSSYLYGVRAVNTHGSSAYAFVQVSTIATLEVATTRADLVDSPKPSKDKIKLVGTYDFLPTASGNPADPVLDGITLRMGPEEAPLALVIQPADGTWKVNKKGKAKWKSPKGIVSKFTVLVDPALRTITVSGKNLQFPGAAANPMRLSVTVGDESGSHGEDWLEKKPGKFQLR